MALSKNIILRAKDVFRNMERGRERETSNNCRIERKKNKKVSKLLEG